MKKRRRRKWVTYDGRMRHYYNGNRSGMRTVLPIAVLMIDASFAAIAGAATRVTRDESVFTPSRIFFCSPSVRATLGSDTKRARVHACVGWAASERVGAEASRKPQYEPMSMPRISILQFRATTSSTFHVST